jgi:prepilin-type N-terminal cleavage/methylation domain-containing protein
LEDSGSEIIKAQARKAMSFGYTIVELLLVISLIGIVSTIIYTFFVTSFNQYFALQQDGMLFGDLAAQSQRIAMVTRGLTDITAASSSEITMYSYFSPNDQYVSQIRYYKNAGGTSLMADVTPMTANPPTGTLITAQKKTYTVVSPFYTLTGVNTFVYFDGNNNQMSLPITDLHTIQQIQVNLAAPTKAPSSTGYDQISVQVSLRNRKINL